MRVYLNYSQLMSNDDGVKRYLSNDKRKREHRGYRTLIKKSEVLFHLRYSYYVVHRAEREREREGEVEEAG